MQKKSELWCTQNLVKMGILGAMAVVVMRALEIPLPIFSPFLKIDFGDVPALIATLIIHPLAGIFVVIIKNILALMGSSSGGVGEIVNVIIGISFIIPIAWFTRKDYHLKHVILGCIVGVGFMMVAGMITNGLITMPLYGEEACIKSGTVINPRIVDKMTYLLYMIAPFNLVKGIIISSVSIIVVKAMDPIVKRLRVKKAS